MDTIFGTVDFDSTIRDYDFTRRAIIQITSVVESDDFENMDSDTIFLYLFKQMELVSFKDYLKRYLTENTDIGQDFSKVSEDEYRALIDYAFEANNAPHSLEPTSTRWTATVKSWLRSDSVRRPAVFLLGFGLCMSAEKVSEFLVKVLKDEDFDFSNAAETVYWYCYRNQLRYAAALELLSEAENATDVNDVRKDLPDGGKEIREQTLVETPKEAIERHLDEKENLLPYLCFLKKSKVHENRQQIALDYFSRLILKAKEEIARIYREDPVMGEDENASGPDKITSADIEKIICSGIPLTSSGNLKKASFSVLNRHFQSFRLSRQRIDSILKGKQTVTRYDLITLEFFLFSQMDYEFPEDRCRDFIDSMNEILENCGMMKLHPVNPYEAFVMMCLATEYPLGTYSDVWELSYS